MRLAVVLLMLGITASTAAAQGAGGGGAAPTTGAWQFPIEPLELVIEVPAGAGAWKMDPSLSKPGEAALFDDDSVIAVNDGPANGIACADVITWAVQEFKGTRVQVSTYGFEGGWHREAVRHTDPQGGASDQLTMCIERAGRFAIVAFTQYPAAAAAQRRAALFANALAAAWLDRVDGVQRVPVDGQTVTVRDRSALWYVDPVDGGLLQLFADSPVSAQFSRDRFRSISAKPTESCESWMQALAKMYSPITPSYLPAPWHPEAVAASDGGFSMVLACLPRKDGGNLIVELVSKGDASRAEFAAAVKPLLGAVGAAIGVPPPPPPAAPPPAAPPPYSPTTAVEYDASPRPPRSAYRAFVAPTLTVSYARLTPSFDGAERIEGATVAVDVPVFSRDRKLVRDLSLAAGYHGAAGWSVDGRAGFGYQLGSERTMVIPVLGLGVDMLDHGEEDAPFQASLAGYGYAALLLRFVVSKQVVIEARGALVKRGGVLDEDHLSVRAILLRGHRRKLSLDFGWRQFEHDDGDALGAELVTFGIGIGG